MVNHRAPSGPAVIDTGALMPAVLKCVTFPAVVIRPIVSKEILVNHNAPSGPAVMVSGPEMLASE